MRRIADLPMQESLVQGLFAGLVTLGVGTTAAVLAPMGKTSAALAGSALASAGVTIVNKRNENGLEPTIISFPKKFPNFSRQREFNLTHRNSLKKSILTTTPETDIDQLVTYLNSQNINLESYHQRTGKDDIFDEIAIFLGDNYSVLNLLHKRMKRYISNKTKFNFRLVNHNQQEINICTRFRHILNEKGIWTSYYSRESKVIRFDLPSNDADITYFLNGGWLERYIVYKTANFLKINNLKYQYISNAKIIDCHGNNFELDALFIVNHKLFVIESKSGQIRNKDLNKYIAHKQLFSIPKERIVLLGLDLSEDETTDWSTSRDITVVNLDNFLNHISNTLELSHSQPEDKIYPTKTPQQLYTILRKRELRPSPVIRKIVIAELIEIFKHINHPVTMKQIQSILYESIKNHYSDSEEISNSKVHEILKAVVAANCLLDEQNNAVYSFVNPAIALESWEISDIENKCITTYAKEILAAESNFFENPHNVRVFEEIVGGKVPNREAIAL